MNAFVDGFTDELTKLGGIFPGKAAAPAAGLMSKIPGKVKALGLGGLGLGAFALGRKKGVERGEAGAMSGMQTAYEMGARDMAEVVRQQLGAGISERE
jgi:hypothetical protein